MYLIATFSSPDSRRRNNRRAASRRRSNNTGGNITTSSSPAQEAPKTVPEPVLLTIQKTSFSSRSPEPSLEDDNNFQPIPPQHPRLCRHCYKDINPEGSDSSHVPSSKCSTGKHEFCRACLQHHIEAFVEGKSRGPLRNANGGLKALPCLLSNQQQCTEGFFSASEVELCCPTETLWEKYQERIFLLMCDDDDDDNDANEEEENGQPASVVAVDDDENTTSLTTTTELLMIMRIRRH